MALNLALVPLFNKVIDTVAGFFPNPEEKAKAQLEIMKILDGKEAREVNVYLEELKTASANITTEGASSDKWTSRARPSFMYVIYLLILSAIPMGVLHAFQPEAAAQITVGFKLWLAAIPAEMLALFGVGYVGYTVARSREKEKGVA